MTRTTSKLPDVGTTIFTIMSALAAEHGAVNLSQGYPDFDPHPDLVALVNHYMQAGKNQYAPMQGLPALNLRIAEKANTLYGAVVDPGTEVTVTSGATEALYAAITAVIHPGDEAIILEPAYDAYAPVIQLNQGRPVYVPMGFPDYTVDWQRVQDAVTARTRLLIINSPHNPSGRVLSSEDITALQDLTARHDLLILSDEVYEHIIFDGRRHESMLRYPDLAARSFVVNSFGKTYHTTGWKIGYCIAPEKLSTEFRKIHQFLTFTSNTPVQHAYADFLVHTEYYLELGDFYRQKRDAFLDMTATSRFKPLPCDGTYFQMMDYSAVTDEPDIEFARRLTTQYKVAAIPPSVFYNDRRDHNVLRFCFAKRDETLSQAAEILCTI